jgi:hypothetical protein
MKKRELLKQLQQEAVTTKTPGTREKGDAGAYNTSVYGQIVRRENLYNYIDGYIDDIKKGEKGPQMVKHNRVYKMNEQKNLEDTEERNEDIIDFAKNSDTVTDDLIDFLEEGRKSNQPEEKILETFKNYVTHLLFLYSYQSEKTISDESRRYIAQELLNYAKEMAPMNEATTVGSALGGVDQGMYSQPAIFAKDRKNWRNKDATYTGGEVVKNDNITNIVSNINENPNELKEFTNAEGGNRYSVWKGGKTVKIKRKCQDFPYCSDGAADNPIKTEKLKERKKK